MDRVTQSSSGPEGTKISTVRFSTFFRGLRDNFLSGEPSNTSEIYPQSPAAIALPSTSSAICSMKQAQDILLSQRRFAEVKENYQSIYGRLVTIVQDYNRISGRDRLADAKFISSVVKQLPVPSRFDSKSKSVEEMKTMIQNMEMSHEALLGASLFIFDPIKAEYKGSWFGSSGLYTLLEPVVKDLDKADIGKCLSMLLFRIASDQQDGKKEISMPKTRDKSRTGLMTVDELESCIRESLEASCPSPRASL